MTLKLSRNMDTTEPFRYPFSEASSRNDTLAYIIPIVMSHQTQSHIFHSFDQPSASLSQPLSRTSHTPYRSTSGLRRRLGSHGTTAVLPASGSSRHFRLPLPFFLVISLLLAPLFSIELSWAATGATVEVGGTTVDEDEGGDGGGCELDGVSIALE